ncbi:hypothetical protein BH23ACI1_BH23ACI1_28090 [soil metagenome]
MDGATDSAGWHHTVPEPHRRETSARGQGALSAFTFVVLSSPVVSLGLGGGSTGPYPGRNLSDRGNVRPAPEDSPRQAQRFGPGVPPRRRNGCGLAGCWISSSRRYVRCWTRRACRPAWQPRTAERASHGRRHRARRGRPGESRARVRGRLSAAEGAGHLLRAFGAHAAGVPQAPLPATPALPRLRPPRRARTARPWIGSMPARRLPSRARRPRRRRSLPARHRRRAAPERNSSSADLGSFTAQKEKRVPEPGTLPQSSPCQASPRNRTRGDLGCPGVVARPHNGSLGIPGRARGG